MTMTLNLETLLDTYRAFVRVGLGMIAAYVILDAASVFVPLM